MNCLTLPRVVDILFISTWLIFFTWGMWIEHRRHRLIAEVEKEFKAFRDSNDKKLGTFVRERVRSTDGR